MKLYQTNSTLARSTSSDRTMILSAEPIFTGERPEMKGNVITMAGKTLKRAWRNKSVRHIVRKYGIAVIAALLMWAWTSAAMAIAEKRAWKEAAAQYEAKYAAQLEEYKAEQDKAEQARYFLSGDASREAFLNQEIDAAARLAAKMGNDTQKGGIICNALARVMNKYYPGTMQEVIAQPDQWMFYDQANKFSTHDREIAERILRDYYENGIIPSGLTEEFVYGSWSENDYVLRNTWDFGSATRTWRYQG